MSDILTVRETKKVYWGQDLWLFPVMEEAGFDFMEYRMCPSMGQPLQVSKVDFVRSFRVLAGTIELKLPGGISHIPSGNSVIVEAGITCVWRNLTRDVASVLVVASGDVLRGFVESVGSEAPETNPRTNLAISEAARFGLEVVTPQVKQLPTISGYISPAQSSRPGYNPSTGRPSI